MILGCQHMAAQGIPIPVIESCIDTPGTMHEGETASSSQPNAKDKTQGSTQLPIATPESVARRLPNSPSTFSSHLPVRDFDLPPASVPALFATEHPVSPGPSACVTSGQGKTTMSVRYGFGAPGYLNA